jgi:hypothetical protein
MTKLTTLQEQLAKDAASFKEDAPTERNNISIRNKIFNVGGEEVDGSTLNVIILDSVYLTTYYKNKFSPKVVTPPHAFAIGRNKDTLVWHDNSHPDFAGKLCKDSNVCQWKPEGGSKDAKEGRKLAVIIAGGDNEDGSFDLITNPDYYANAKVFYLTLAPMTVKNYVKYVNTLASKGLPPYAAATRLSFTDDDYAALKFNMVNQVTDLLSTTPLMDRVKEAREEIMTPLGKWDDKPVEVKAKY